MEEHDGNISGQQKTSTTIATHRDEICGDSCAGNILNNLSGQMLAFQFSLFFCPRNDCILMFPLYFVDILLETKNDKEQKMFVKYFTYTKKKQK